MSARLRVILIIIIICLVAGVVGLVYSSTLLSQWTVVQKFQLWADHKLTKAVFLWDRATVRPLPQAKTWLPGKVRIGEIRRDGKTEKLYFVGAEVKEWNPDSGILSLESFGNGVAFSASVQPGDKSSRQHGTLVMLPNTSGDQVKTASFLVPDLWSDENQSPDSTWRLMFCPGDAVQVGWLIHQPLTQMADFWGQIRPGVNIDAEVIVRHLRQFACLR